MSNSNQKVINSSKVSNQQSSVGPQSASGVVVLKTIAEMQAYRSTLAQALQAKASAQQTSQAELTIGFVPTMGALHAGHKSLIERSVAENDVTIVSIYVNQTQFNDPKDFEKYPITWESDLMLVQACGAQAIFNPTFTEMYPDQYRYKMTETEFSKQLCGAHRPGHFDGVLSVVLKLFNLVRPTRAYFGEKDFQQLSLIEDMVRAYFLSIEIVRCATLRETSGLAMSSRNTRLSDEGRKKAAMIYQVISQAKSAASAREQLIEAGFEIDYVEDHGDRRFVAAFLEGVRLIDNVQTGQSATNGKPTPMIEFEKRNGAVGTSATAMIAAPAATATKNLPPFGQVSKTENKNILVLMTGSIAAYKVCHVLSALKQKGHHVKVVATQGALQFVGNSTIEGLIGEPVLSDLYESGRVMDHIRLARWADLILVAPATANTINKFAAGIGDDLVSTLFLATDFSVPVLIAPAMNTKMYLHQATQRSLESLKSMGCHILDSASGPLACGEIGAGRLVEPELILQSIESALSKNKKNSAGSIAKPARSQRSLRILVTGGGTVEPIDDVRVITNSSTGKTAALIVDGLSEYGFDVHGVFAKSAQKPLNAKSLETFYTFQDLQSILEKKLQEEFDVVIHAAAVSDYSVESEGVGKISSSNEKLQLSLKKNPKLIDSIKAISPKTLLIGFKLTSQADEKLVLQKVSQLMQSAKCDLVIHNDWKQIQSGAHLFSVWENTLKSSSSLIDAHKTSAGLALPDLIDLISEKILENFEPLEKVTTVDQPHEQRGLK